MTTFQYAYSHVYSITAGEMLQMIMNKTSIVTYSLGIEKANNTNTISVYCSVGYVKYNNIALMNMAVALTIDLFCVGKSISGGTMGLPPHFDNCEEYYRQY